MLLELNPNRSNWLKIGEEILIPNPKTQYAQTNTGVSTDILSPPEESRIGDIWTRSADDMVMSYIPAGDFQMGSKNGDPDEKPVHTISTDAFWIDQKEISNNQFSIFVEQTSYQTDVEKEGYSNSYIGGTWSKVAGMNWLHPTSPDLGININDHPVTHISWNDAEKYCEWVEARLPTEGEWEKAARGGIDGVVYPWGNKFDGAQENFCDMNCSLDWANTSINDGYAHTSPGASFPPNNYGLYDMAGNLWEWVADWYDEDYYENSPSLNPLGPATGSTKTMRGGSWNQYDVFLRSANRGYYFPDSSGSGIGFRCARSTTP